MNDYSLRLFLEQRFITTVPRHASFGGVTWKGNQFTLTPLVHPFDLAYRRVKITFASLSQNKKAADMFERPDREAKSGFQFTPAPLFLGVLCLIAVLGFSTSRALAAEGIQQEKSASESMSFRDLPRDHISPRRECILSVPAHDTPDLSSQVVQEFENAIKRYKIALKLFNCPSRYIDVGFAACEAPTNLPITGVLKSLIPRTAASSELEYSTFPQDDLYTDKRVLDLLKDKFAFEAGRPYGVQVPKTDPVIDSVQCGYCQPATEEKFFIADYQICLFIRGGLVRDLYAAVKLEHKPNRSKEPE